MKRFVSFAPEVGGSVCLCVCVGGGGEGGGGVYQSTIPHRRSEGPDTHCPHQFSFSDFDSNYLD